MLWGQRESRVRAAMLVRDGGVAVEGTGKALYRGDI